MAQSPLEQIASCYLEFRRLMWVSIWGIKKGKQDIASYN